MADAFMANSLPANVPADIGSWQADLDPSTERYAARFAGPVGEWMLARQTEALMRFVAPWPGATVLDVGGGHGQTAAPLLAAGYDVTVLASSEAALGRAAALPGVKTAIGPLTDPPFPERCFDIVVSFRMMAHIGDWRRYLAGLARTARHEVIVDFPIPGSANALEPLLFRLKKRLEGDTRRYAMMRRDEVRETFEGLGFKSVTSVGQFVLPMVLHRLLNMPKASETLEKVCAELGLLNLTGSPVVMAAQTIV